MTEPGAAEAALQVSHAASPRVRGRRTPVEIAVVTAAGLALTSGLLVVADPIGPVRLLAFLLAVAAACVGGLAVHRAPSVAWLASIAAGYVAATIVFDQARSLAPDRVDLAIWVATAAAASVWAVATAWIAGRYASRPGCRLDPVAVPVASGIVGWVVVACLTTIGVVLAGQRTPDPSFNWIDVATVPIGSYLVLLLALTALGAGADVRAARERARERLAPTVDEGWAARTWRLAAATAREVVPGQAAAVSAAQESERSRIAGDLHASVLPTLRRAIAEAEAGGDVEVLARRLRAVDLELERLMADRWPVVLEAFGIVAALEDLAEALEADGSPVITIDVERSGTRPPAAIERAAWRFAQIALDNAVRHASATVIGVTVAVDATVLRLVVADDGGGFDPAASGYPAGRGLADATRRAAEVGARIRVEPRVAGGSVVSLEWETAGS